MREREHQILLQLGYRDEALLFASTIAEARALLQEEPVAIALIDVGLPDGNGIDLIAEMHISDPSLPILVVSSWSTETIIVQALQAGAIGYLLKERDDVEILVSIRSALRGGAPIDPFVARHILGLFGQTSERYGIRVTEGQMGAVPGALPSVALVPPGMRNTPSGKTDASVVPGTEPPVQGIVGAGAGVANYDGYAAALVASAERASILSKREHQILAAVGDGLSNREIADRLALSKLTVESHIKNIYKKLSVTSRTAALLKAGLIVKR